MAVVANPALIYRSENGPAGDKQYNLTPDEVDGNFKYLDEKELFAKARPWVRNMVVEQGDLITQWGQVVNIANPANFNTDFQYMYQAMAADRAANPFFNQGHNVVSKEPFKRVHTTAEPGISGITDLGDGLHVILDGKFNIDATAVFSIGFSTNLTRLSFDPQTIYITQTTANHNGIDWDSPATWCNNTIPALPAYTGTPTTTRYEFLRTPNGKLNLVSVGTVSGTGSTTPTPTAETLQTLTDNGSTVTLNSSTSKEGKVTLTGNRALVISNLPTNAVLFGTIEVYQDATGGYGLTLPAGSKVINGGAGALTLTATPNALDLISWRWNGTFLTFTLGKNYN